MNPNQTSDVVVAQAPHTPNGRKKRVADSPDASRLGESKQNYVKLVETIKLLVQITTPTQSTLLVISKGDDDLLDLGERFAWHFPRAINGKFAGCYPANSAEAIGHLEMLRTQGANYLLIPSTSFWWLEFYSDFTTHLQQNYRVITFQEDVCIVYGLLER